MWLLDILPGASTNFIFSVGKVLSYGNAPEVLGGKVYLGFKKSLGKEPRCILQTSFSIGCSWATFTKGKEIVVSHNPLRWQYLKQHATDEVYWLYAKTHDRRVKAKEEKKIQLIIMSTNSRNIAYHLNQNEIMYCWLLSTQYTRKKIKCRLFQTNAHI